MAHRGCHSGHSVTELSPVVSYKSAMRKLLVILAPAALLAAGCGGSPRATTNASNPQSFVQAAYKYSACMREHGVPNFPDPKVVDHNGEHGIAIRAVGGNSPAFKTAQSACQSILPNGGQGPSPAQQHARAAGLVSFARCMRNHAITSFPDPTPQGQIRPQMLSAAGVDIHSPGVLKAAYACVSSSDGQLTRADIAQATKGG
jgi:hypothetical protein